MSGGWTTTLVEARLREAAETLRRLPLARPRGYFTAWPEPVRSVSEAHGYTPARLRPPPPPPAAIDRLDEVLGWMGWLDDEQIRLLWARAAGVPWRPLCQRLGRGRTTAWRLWVAALMALRERLEAEGVPARPTGE